MKSTDKQNILFITGAFVSHTGWDQWVRYFENLGYAAVAPSWPEKNGTAQELRLLQPNDTGLAELTLEDVIAHYARIALKFDQKPIVIGHSLGGLIAQILLDRGLAQAGVAIHSVPPQGIFPYEFTFLRSTWKVLGLFSSMKKTYLMSFSDFQYAFVNGMPLEEQKRAYTAYAIPESKRVARGGLTSAAAVNFKKKRPPLLITAGTNDHVIPAHLSNRNYKKYAQNDAVLDYTEFDTNHSVLTAAGWEREAEFIAQWLEKKLVQ